MARFILSTSDSTAHTSPRYGTFVTWYVGRTQEWEGPIEEIKPGDVIWCPPKVKHWHDASPTTAMTHIAITGTLNGGWKRSPTINTT